MDRNRDKLKQLLKSKSVLHGNFTLASQESSDSYIDARIAALHPEGVNLISKIFFDEITKDREVEAVGCPESVGGNPIVGAIVFTSSMENAPLRGFIVRKNRKDYGTRKIVEGEPIKGSKVVMIEDVINTGGSVLKAIGRATEEGAKVDRVLCVIDRGENTEKVFEKEGYKFFSIFKSSELLEEIMDNAPSDSE